MCHIKTNKTLHLTEILTHLKSFNNYIHSTEDKPSQTSYSFFRNNWFLSLNSIISLQHLPRTTLFKLICRVYAVNRFNKHRHGTIRACMEFPGLYGIYRLALSQSNFLRPGLVRVGHIRMYLTTRCPPKKMWTSLEKYSSALKLGKSTNYILLDRKPVTWITPQLWESVEN